MNETPMWRDSRKSSFSTPRSKRGWKSAPCTPIDNKKSPQPASSARVDSFHNKVPNGDSPYVKAKHVQLIDRDPSKAISLFWSAINACDRVDSALKDMAVVMKQLNRTDEAIEAIKSFRHLCTPEAQESLDNLLIDLYKRGGRTEEHIELLQHKLRLIEEGIAFGGKKTKTARAHGKKFYVSVEQEKSRLLGNLAWAYMLQKNYKAAEELYRKALSIELDKNKQCNLSICLMNMGRIIEAKSLLQVVIPSSAEREMEEPFVKSFDRAHEILFEIESESSQNVHDQRVEGKVDINISFATPSKEDQPIFMEKPCSSSVQEKKKGSYSRKPLDDRLDSSGSDDVRWNREVGFEGQSSGYSPFADTWKKETSPRRVFEAANSFSGLQNVEFISNSGSEEFHASKTSNTCGSPFSIKRSSKLKSGHPNCAFQPSSNGDWRTLWEYDADKKRGLQYGDLMRSCDYGVGKKRGGITPIKNPTTRETIYALQSPANGDWRRQPDNCGTENTQPTTTPGIIIAPGICGNVQAFSNQSLDRRSQVTVSGSITGMGTLEESSATDPITEKSAMKHQDFFSSFKNGKSWADMVEEEEEELLRECMDTSNIITFPEETSVFSFQTPCKSVDRWNDARLFQDENMDSNIMGSSPHPLNYTRSSRENIESSDLEEVQRKSSDSSSCRGSPARRALSFQKTDSAGNSRLSPARRALSFQKKGSADIQPLSPLQKMLFNLGDDEDYDPAVPMECGVTGYGHGKQEVRNEKSRLQVFQEITPHCVR